MQLVVEIVGGLGTAALRALLKMLRRRLSRAWGRLSAWLQRARARRVGRREHLQAGQRRMQMEREDRQLLARGATRVVGTSQLRRDVTVAKWSDGSETFHFHDLQRYKNAMSAREVPPTRTFCCNRPRVGDLARSDR